MKASVLSAADAGHGKLDPAMDLVETSNALLKRETSQLEPREDGRLVRVYA